MAARNTQLPVLAAWTADTPPARLTQLVVMVASKESTPSRVTQLPVLICHGPPIRTVYVQMQETRFSPTRHEPPEPPAPVLTSRSISLTTINEEIAPGDWQATYTEMYYPLGSPYIGAFPGATEVIGLSGEYLVPSEIASTLPPEWLAYFIAVDGSGYLIADTTTEQISVDFGLPLWTGGNLDASNLGALVIATLAHNVGTHTYTFNGYSLA